MRAKIIIQLYNNQNYDCSNELIIACQKEGFKSINTMKAKSFKISKKKIKRNNVPPQLLALTNTLWNAYLILDNNFIIYH
jgi:hypothetical protein